MDNPDIGGLPQAVNQWGEALSTMITLPNDKTERDKMDDILRGVDRNLSTLTERVAHIQSSVDKLTTKLDKIDGDLITKEEYFLMRRWLTGTTVDLIIAFILACFACAGVLYLFLYLAQGGL